MKVMIKNSIHIRLRLHHSAKVLRLGVWGEGVRMASPQPELVKVWAIFERFGVLHKMAMTILMSLVFPCHQDEDVEAVIRDQ